MKTTDSILHFSTVIPLLKDSLCKLMEMPEFERFRLVGGTNLSLRFGHRMSQDIDLFTGDDYDTVDFQKIDTALRSMFRYVSPFEKGENAFGRTFYIGESENKCIKLDVMYTEPFIDEEDMKGNIRMATTVDIAAMKIEAVQTGARKKDFWDLHLLLDYFSLEQMLSFHQRRFPYTHDEAEIINKMTDFNSADQQPDPICLAGKDWDEIKMDIIDEIENYTQSSHNL